MSSSDEPSIHFSTGNDEQRTPLDLFSALDAEFCFDIDLCATLQNALCPTFFTKREDALTRSWADHGTSGFCNPPYSRASGGPSAFLPKGIEAAAAGMVVVFLLPCRPETRWWHEYVMRADEVRLIRGRLTFGEAANPAPFPSCIVVYRPQRACIVDGLRFVVTPTARPIFSVLTKERLT